MSPPPFLRKFTFDKWDPISIKGGSSHGGVSHIVLSSGNRTSSTMFKLAVVAVVLAVACAAPRPYGRPYGAPAYGRSYAAPAYKAPVYGAPAYSAPSYSAPAYGYSAPAHDYAVPTPYDFGYDIAGDYGEFKQNRKESSDGKGNVQGSYGYTDAHGIYRQVDYVADAYGFRANVKTNEPGTDNQNPADVQIHANPAHYQAPAPHYGGYPRY